jgi:hypothetical protein
VLAWIVATGLSVLALEVLGRRGQRRVAAVILTVGFLVPAAFQEGLLRWAEGEAETWTRWLSNVSTATTTSTTAGTTPGP